jgi:hypothetical protein
MNTIPKVTIRPESAGWTATCSGCPWEMHHVGRRVLDKAADQHQGKCRGGAR